MFFLLEDMVVCNLLIKDIKYILNKFLEYDGGKCSKIK